MSKLRIHQFVHTLNYGDAISGEALALRRVFRDAGFESEIFSVHAHEKVKSKRRSWKEYDADRTDVVLLHYSIGSPLNQLFIEQSGVKKALIYHNITPESWFLSYNSRVAEDVKRGRADLPTVLDAADIILGDSDYNCEEIRALGRTDAQVLSLVLDEAKWSLPANEGIARVLRATGGPNILHCGRIVPNKKIEDIIKSFYFFHHKIQPKSKLWLIGSDIDTEIYSFELRSLVTELRLKNAVEFVGSVSDGELKSFYQECDLYLCLSEHEGFCVPLIEAMHFGLPVIAYDSCAVGDTLRDGGILISKKSPALIAELMQMLVTDEELRGQMISKGQESLQRYSYTAFSDTVNRTLIQPILDASRTTEVQNRLEGAR